MSELSKEEIFQIEAKERETRKEKIMEEHVEDKIFWEKLVKEVKEGTQKEAVKTGVIEEVETLTAKNLLEKKFPETIWLVENLIPAEGFTALTGTPSSYKSFLTEHLAIALSMNQPFLGHFPVTPGAVLLIDKENPLSLLQERFKKLGVKEEAKIYFLLDPDHYKLQDEDHLNWTINFIKENSIKLVIIDSFVHIHKGDENDSQAIATTFEKLKLLPCAVIFIHHHRKTIKFFTGTPLESIRGSSDIAAEVESHLAADIVNNGLRIAQYKNRRGELTKPFLVTPIITEDTITFSYSGEIDEEISKVEKAKQAIVETFKVEFTRPKARQTFDGQIGEHTLDIALKQLVSAGFYTSEIIGRVKTYKPTQLITQTALIEISSPEQSYIEEAE